MYEDNPLAMNEACKALMSLSIFNDTLFLSKVNVMDYSLLVGVDESGQLLVVGIIGNCLHYPSTESELACSSLHTQITSDSTPGTSNWSTLSRAVASLVAARARRL